MACYLKFVLVASVLCQLGLWDAVWADNTHFGGLYYEAPCCGHHHVRHHRGKSRSPPESDLHIPERGKFGVSRKITFSCSAAIKDIVPLLKARKYSTELP
ncbi:Hypothetical predicted protein [Cloeon dipterum]|uniref:Secreted protein n=1 Tax=Cloeon dipterum TaxID=197152 RepID=A0A8S1DPV0_9INSE|nr:Hypothetical predicted protein [Cloeon dipterum]